MTSATRNALIRVRQEGFAGNIESATGHAEGWKRVLGWLEAFVEQGESGS